MDNYQTFKNVWPFCDFFSFVEQILEDGIVIEKERKDFQELCVQFTEIVIPEAVIHDPIYLEGWMQNYSPVFRPFTAYCDYNAKIIFQDRNFCFTGPAKYGARSLLENMVTNLGGCPKSNVSSILDYLVIGAQSSPCWAYSTYGRKIEKAITLQKDGTPIVILHENHFLEQAEILVVK
jgi:NAD-dependent DNA ligase